MLRHLENIVTPCCYRQKSANYKCQSPNFWLFVLFISKQRIEVLLIKMNKIFKKREIIKSIHGLELGLKWDNLDHGLRTPREVIAFTARPKIQSQSQIFRYGRSIFYLPHRPNFSDIFDLCCHWVSVVRVPIHWIVCVLAY